MKTMSVLLSFALLLAANQLAAQLKRAGVLPVDHLSSPASTAAKATTRTNGLTAFNYSSVYTNKHETF